MRRILTIAATLGMGAALAGTASQLFPAARTLFGGTVSPLARVTASTRAESAIAKDASTPSESKGAAEKAPDGSIDMPPEWIVAQEIEVAPVEKGVLARMLVVPGTITLDMDMVARVPGRVVGTVTQMRKRLGDAVTQGEVVAVLDSREVADAKSEYLTASVFFDLKKTLFERAQTLWAKKISAEQQYLQARETFLEAELRTRTRPAKTLRAEFRPG